MACFVYFEAMGEFSRGVFHLWKIPQFKFLRENLSIERTTDFLVRW